MQCASKTKAVAFAAIVLVVVAVNGARSAHAADSENTVLHLQRGNFMIAAVFRSSSKQVRDDVRPWLIYVAKASDSQGIWTRTGWGTAPDKVTLNERTFSYAENVRQVVLDRDSEVVMRRVKPNRYCSLERLAAILATKNRLATQRSGASAELTEHHVQEALDDVFGPDAPAEKIHRLNAMKAPSDAK